MTITNWSMTNVIIIYDKFEKKIVLFFLSLNKKLNMDNLIIVPLRKFPKKLLLYFIGKHPHCGSIKKSVTTEELENIIIEQDISCHWDETAYSLATVPILEQKCRELQKHYDTIGKEYSTVSFKKKKEMIDFLLQSHEEEFIFQQIKNCLRKQENIDLSIEEINSFFL